jgi:hypothetical protein
MPAEEMAASTTAETETAEPESEETEITAEETQEVVESSTSETSEPEEGESVTPPEGAKPERTNAESRIKQLTRQVKALERRIAEVQPAAVQRPALTEPDEPILDNFETIEQFNAASTKYKTDLRQFVAEQTRREIEQATVRAQEEKHKAERQATWNKRAEQTKKRNPEFDDAKYIEAVEPSPAMDVFMGQSEIGSDLLNYLYENPEEADAIRELPYHQANRELYKLEERVSSQIKGIKPKTAPSKPGGYVSGTGAHPAKAKTAAEVLYGN